MRRVSNTREEFPDGGMGMTQHKTMQQNENWRAWAWVALIGLTALATRLYHLDFNSLHGDEFITLQVCRMSVKEAISNRIGYGHFPTYYLFMKGWMAIWGESAVAMRLPSAFASSLWVVYLMLTAKRLWGIKSAIAVGLLGVFSPESYWAAQYARPYAQVMLSVTASLHGLIAAAQTEKKRWWTAWAAWSALGLVSQATFLFVFIGQISVIFFWGWMRREKYPRFWRRLISWGAVLIVFAVWCSWLVGRTTRDHSKGHKIMKTDLTHYYDGTLLVFWGEVAKEEVWAGKFILLLAAAGVIAITAWAELRHRARRPGATHFLPVWPLLMAQTFSAIVILGGISSFHTNVVHTLQYFSPGIGGAVLLLVAATRSAPKPLLRRISTGLAIVVTAYYGWCQTSVQYPQLREAVHYLLEHRKADEHVFLCNYYGRSGLQVSYYGLEDKPFYFRTDNRYKDYGDVERLSSELDALDSFWLILCRTSEKKMLDALDKAGAGRFKMEMSESFFRTRTYFFKRMQAVDGKGDHAA